MRRGRVRVEDGVELGDDQAIDPRSHGRSADAATGHSYPQQGRDLAAVLRALDLREADLVGWSYGALACYAYAEQFGTERRGR